MTAIIIARPPLNVIASNGLAWTFSSNLTPGQWGRFVTGDYWVVGPVTVSSQSPAWDGEKHGAMVNPSSSAAVQGYESRAGLGFAYSAPVRETFPLDLVAGDSLVSVMGRDTPAVGGGASYISRAAVLTVLASPPSANSFRPPYVNSTKTLWSVEDVDYSLLPNLALPSGSSAINMSRQSEYFNRVWLHHGNLQTYNANIHPTEHGSTTGYPADTHYKMGQMLVACMAAIPAATKRSIVNRVIQYGIDCQAMMSDNGHTWSRQGGFGAGRKGPILLAKALLGESWTLPYYVSGSSGPLKFQEDSHTYEGASSVDRFGEVCDTVGYSGTYAGGNHLCRSIDGIYDQWELNEFHPELPDGENAGPYESLVAREFVGPALMARLMESSAGLMTAWGHTPFFDYTDRWVNEIADAWYVQYGSAFPLDTDANIDSNKYAGTGQGDHFMKRMWETYR
jgi:hypothetical protein